MLKHFKFQDTESSKLFVTGCLHLGHLREFIWRDRDYKSPEEHSQGVIDKINSICRPSDVLLVLGDFCLNTTLPQFDAFINKINPKIWMISGNHGSPWTNAYLGWSMAKFGHEAINVDWPNFKNMRYLGHYVELNWNKQDICCFHYPIRVFNNSKRNWWHIHSHNHGKLKSSLPEAQEGKILDVGWDVFQKPVSFEEISCVLRRKTAKSFDDHH